MKDLILEFYTVRFTSDDKEFEDFDKVFNSNKLDTLKYLSKLAQLISDHFGLEIIHDLKSDKRLALPKEDDENLKLSFDTKAETIFWGFEGGPSNRPGKLYKDSSKTKQGTSVGSRDSNLASLPFSLCLPRFSNVGILIVSDYKTHKVSNLIRRELMNVFSKENEQIIPIISKIMPKSIASVFLENISFTNFVIEEIKFSSSDYDKVDGTKKVSKYYKSGLLTYKVSKIIEEKKAEFKKKIVSGLMNGNLTGIVDIADFDNMGFTDRAHVKFGIKDAKGRPKRVRVDQIIDDLKLYYEVPDIKFKDAKSDKEKLSVVLDEQKRLLKELALDRYPNNKENFDL